MKKRHVSTENDPISALWRSWRAFLAGGLCGILLASGLALRWHHSNFLKLEQRAAQTEKQLAAIITADLPALNRQLRRHLWTIEDYIPRGPK